MVLLKTFQRRKSAVAWNFPILSIKNCFPSQLQFTEDYLTIEATTIKKTSKGKGNQIWPGIFFKNLCSHILSCYRLTALPKNHVYSGYHSD